MSEAERKLLVLVATLLAKLILWKSISSNEAHKVYEALEKLK